MSEHQKGIPYSYYFYVSFGHRAMYLPTNTDGIGQQFCELRSHKDTRISQAVFCFIFKFISEYFWGRPKAGRSRKWKAASRRILVYAQAAAGRDQCQHDKSLRL